MILRTPFNFLPIPYPNIATKNVLEIYSSGGNRLNKIKTVEKINTSGPSHSIEILNSDSLFVKRLLVFKSRNVNSNIHPNKTSNKSRANGPGICS